MREGFRVLKYSDIKVYIAFVLFCIIVVQIVSLICNYDTILAFVWFFGVNDFCFLLFMLLFVFDVGVTVGYKYIKE